MSLQQLIVSCIASSIAAKKFVELVNRLALREKDTIPDLEFRSSLTKCLLTAIQQFPAARPIVITYLQECIAAELLTTSQTVGYVLEYGKAAYGGSKHTDIFPSAGDVDRFCTIFYEELPSSTLDEKSFITETSPLVELLHSLIGLLADVNEQHPGICQLFTTFLSVVSGLQVYSEAEQETIYELKAATNQLSTIPQSILQDIRLIGTSSTVIGPPGLSTAQWGLDTRDEFGAGDDDPSPPTSPDPWTIGPVPVNGQTNAAHIVHIRAPSYITLLVKDALETPWNHSLGDNTDMTRTTEIPDSYKRIVHTAPEVCSRPTTFLYHLLCSSFGLLALSLDELQKRAVKEQNRVSNMADNTDEVMMSLNGGQTGSISDNMKSCMMKEIIARDGWKTWTWCFSGIFRLLEYWKALSRQAEGDVFQQKWQLPSMGEFEEVIAGFNNVYGRELQRCNEVLQIASGGSMGETKAIIKRIKGGADELTSFRRTIDLLELFKEEAVRADLLPAADPGTLSGSTVVAGKGAVSFDAQALLELDLTRFPHEFFDILLSPASWQSTSHQMIQLLRHSSPTSDNLLNIVITYNGFLDLVCESCPPQQVLDLVHNAIVRHDEPLKIDSDDPQAHLTTFGLWYLLACILCDRYKLRKPEILRTCTDILNIKDLTEEDGQTTRSWIEALFGSSGISDDLLQITSPIKLLRLSTTIVAQAILAASAQVIDLETLRGGLSYFSQSLLSWCQVGIIRWLCCEIQRQGMYAHIYLDVLQALLGAGDFPASILRLTAENILQLFEEGNGLELVLESSNIDILGIQKKARFSQYHGTEGESSFTSQTGPHTCSNLLRLALQSPQAHSQDIAMATQLYGLVCQVRRTHSFQAVNYRSETKGDAATHRLLTVIASNLEPVGHL
ncbi:hypothetical protein QFC21_001494 [Naganishia friedmannii]|uniref:Uncharacterized protein n=1 Tax=Naganishia friedmannii TaxID=89922 RepID=A0ACC2W4L9_9TREE|nr:hypothetical protein QFC21_001494 [Naganishia friedmannii]